MKILALDRNLLKTLSNHARATVACNVDSMGQHTMPRLFASTWFKSKRYLEPCHLRLNYTLKWSDTLDYFNMV